MVHQPRLVVLIMERKPIQRAVHVSLAIGHVNRVTSIFDDRSAVSWAVCSNCTSRYNLHKYLGMSWTTR